MKNIILGAGIAGITAAYELKQHGFNSIILEKNDNWGGLLDNFVIQGFRFDKFVHFSFSNDDYVNKIFFETQHFKHLPISSNYYKGHWLKHPAQNNLFSLNSHEKELILNDFVQRIEKKEVEIKNYEEWLRIQYGDYFAENFPMIYTEKYWTICARDLETKWVGSRMYKPSFEEVKRGCETEDTPNTYYAKEMRYPKDGGYKSFLNPLIHDTNILTNQKVTTIDLESKEIVTDSGEVFLFDNLISSLPLPELCKIIKKIPPNVLDASLKLNYTSGYLISLGFNKPNIAKNLWFYIYDKGILPARVYSPSLKSPQNVPEGCSSLQAEVYFNKGNKINLSDDYILDDTINKLIDMGLFCIEDLVVKDIRVEKYANVIFDHFIYENRKIVLDYLEEYDIIPIGRFGEWDYYWSDQSMLSGRNGAHKLINRLIK